ncbi:hypothetical protein NOR53_3601 [gamma proteobacterium NOR5-3]|nr:hypothetical protein NOR53_3601 [gamma proteobacterium NOR5-3]
MSKFFRPLLFLLLCLTFPTQAQESLRPYELVDTFTGSLAEATDSTRSALENSAFEVVGEYSPYAGATVIAITHPALLQAASEKEFGGYAAVLRMGLTEVDGKVQRSYANPGYWGPALQVGSLDPVNSALKEVFGDSRPFGSEKGLSNKKLSNYRYMMMMPRLRDHDKLGSFPSHAAAVATIRKNLEDNSHSLVKVFEVAIPDSDEVLFGVGIGSGDGSDSEVMGTTDRGELRHTAHLPYALLVSGRHAYALAGKFRIALAFPDLSMGTFMKISGAPNAIRDSLESLASSETLP